MRTIPTPDYVVVRKADKYEIIRGSITLATVDVKTNKLNIPKNVVNNDRLWEHTVTALHKEFPYITAIA